MPASTKIIEEIAASETSVEALEEAIAAADTLKSARLHVLIDREFLQILTSQEADELAALLTWRDQRKAAHYSRLQSTVTVATDSFDLPKS
jgi:hypothetical protein